MTNETSKHNILIVEDHELTRFGLKTTFSDVDFIETIYEASSAKKAYEIVKNNKIDIIIMDLGLPVCWRSVSWSCALWLHSV